MAGATKTPTTAESVGVLLSQIQQRQDRVNGKRREIAAAASSTLDRLLPERRDLRKRIQERGASDEEADRYRKLCYLIALLQKNLAAAKKSRGN
jgi:hypothetical protein